MTTTNIHSNEPIVSTYLKTMVRGAIDIRKKIISSE